ncbi:D-glucuronyl C5-epimerase family protein [Ahrensia kielensis]|uniref:D-glucuronyl C5-epimerase family protein n=1 Tax=Ahrensia kielensis TaxID=76980 RepID=A0ABU9T802_9HYPH
MIIHTNKVLYDKKKIDHFLQQANQIVPTQPSVETCKLLETSVVAEDDGVRHLSDFPKSDLPKQHMNALLLDGYPYFSYYSQKDSKLFIAHPMRSGKFLLDNASGDLAPPVAQAILSRAHRLPNGGLAWYYPRHYNVARMLGPYLKYSAISQGTLLGGFAAAGDRHDFLARSAKETFKAFLWPFQLGGVNLNNVAVLEMPSFAGPPEIILNGWIDALLHIRDYGEKYSDHEALNLFSNNINFLTEILPLFDCREQNISRYSDLCPYRAKVVLASKDDVKSLRVLYVPKFSQLDPILVPLKMREDGQEFSNYENQILRQNGKNCFVWLSCSQLYDTVLIADSKEMSVHLNAGVLNRKYAGPGVEPLGVEITKQTVMEDDGTCRIVLSTSDGLHGGYPTNFAKDGIENFYHCYHVISMLVLAVGNLVPVQQKNVIVKWALQWLDDMSFIKEKEGLIFRDPQMMLDAVNASKITPSIKKIDDLLVEANKGCSF